MNDLLDWVRGLFRGRSEEKTTTTKIKIKRPVYQQGESDSVSVANAGDSDAADTVELEVIEDLEFDVVQKTPDSKDGFNPYDTASFKVPQWRPKDR